MASGERSRPDEFDGVHEAMVKRHFSAGIPGGRA